MLGFFSIFSNPNKFQVILGILAVVVVLILLLGILYNITILCVKAVLNLVFSYEFPQSQRWPCSFPSLNYGRKYGLATAFITFCWVQTMSSVTLGHIYFLNSTPFLENHFGGYFICVCQILQPSWFVSSIIFINASTFLSL